MPHCDGRKEGLFMLSRFSPGSNPFEPALAAAGRGRPRHMLAMLLLLGLPIAAQSPGILPQGAQDTGSGIQRDSESLGAAGIDARMEARRIAALNQQRQHQMVSDADKLL